MTTADRPSDPASPPPFRPPSWFPWVLAGGLALVAVALSLALGQRETELRARQASESLALVEIRSVNNELEAERILSRGQLDQLRASHAEITRLRAQLAEVTSPVSGLRLIALTPPIEAAFPATALVAWDPVAQQGLLTVARLPAPEAGKVHRLWMVADDSPDPIACGEIPADSADGETRLTFKPARPVESPAKLIISVEPVGGERLEGPLILLGP